MQCYIDQFLIDWLVWSGDIWFGGFPRNISSLSIYFLTNEEVNDIDGISYASASASEISIGRTDACIIFESGFT